MKTKPFYNRQLIKSINPTDEQLIAEYKLHSDKDVQIILDELEKSFSSWRKTSFQERADLLNKVADILTGKKESLARLISLEMGKVYKEAIAEIEKCAITCRYYAENGEKFLSDEIIETEAQKSFVTYQPLGVILAIMPWNFPFWQVFRFAAPTLMAGNVCALKHASNVPACAIAIEEIFKEAGYPDIFRSLLVTGSNVKQVIENPVIKAVTLTGSTEAGKSVASIAGGVLKKTVLELGGSDPYIVLKDADVIDAATICAKSRLINAGQSCISAKRFIVEEAVYDEFLDMFTKIMGNKKFGIPFVENTDIGPLATVGLRNNLHRQVENSISEGAGCVLGGYIPEGKGAFYPPTILTNIKPGMIAFNEELFGPVAAVIKAKDKENAISLANNSVFGLGAAIFSKDIESATDMAKYHVESGSCFINELVSSNPSLPFGGIKQSGYGRELGVFGIREFVNIKTVYIK